MNIIGGCCGTTDAYIAKYAELIKNAEPRKPVGKPDCMWLWTGIVGSEAGD